MLGVAPSHDEIGPRRSGRFRQDIFFGIQIGPDIKMQESDFGVFAGVASLFLFGIGGGFGSRGFSLDGGSQFRGDPSFHVQRTDVEASGSRAGDERRVVAPRRRFADRLRRRRHHAHLGRGLRKIGPFEKGRRRRGLLGFLVPGFREIVGGDRRQSFQVIFRLFRLEKLRRPNLFFPFQGLENG